MFFKSNSILSLIVCHTKQGSQWCSW